MKLKMLQNFQRANQCKGQVRSCIPFEDYQKIEIVKIIYIIINIMGLTILIFVGFILFLALIGIILKKFFFGKKTQVQIKSQEAIQNNQHINLGDQEAIPDSHQSQIHKQQSQVKTQKQSNTPNRKNKQNKKKQLIADIAFQFNDDSDNENDKNSSGNDQQQSINMREQAGFNFQQSEHNLEELVTPTQVNSQEI
ncbi:unnamed protein product [Paramecium octaurelia]|uniref:Transmembrane protein n=1 Tax=Paramecium octaurelia TaxID=43137 RepID=A0A8S1S6E7_PAROT|nr:unnamed protein product [Paramecium octaurelia]